jgi:hypothetical protein
MSGDARTPAATEGLEPNDTGVAVKRVAPDGAAGTAGAGGAGEVLSRLVDRFRGAVPGAWRVGRAVTERFAFTRGVAPGEYDGGTWVSVGLRPDFSVGVALCDERAL